MIAEYLRTAAKAAPLGLQKLQPQVGAGNVTEDEKQADGDSGEARAPRGRRLQTPRDAIVESTIDAGLSRQQLRALLRANAKAIVILVPTAIWVKPISGYVESLLPEAHYIVRDGSNTKKDPTDGSDVIASALATGRNVVGVTHAEGLLPPLLTRAADLRLVLPAPKGAAVARAIRLSLRGRLPRDVPADLGAGLDFDELVAAIRFGSSPAETIARIQAMSNSQARPHAGSNLPPLKDAVFYGAAQKWALALVEDIESVRRGEADWDSLSGAAVFFGPPGTGKTVLARMIAAESKLPLVEASIGELFATSAGYLDSIVKAQRAVFARAAAIAPAVLFWDELDGLPNRATMSPRGRDWWLPVIDDFLLQVSNLPKNVVLLGATNLIGQIDEALLRPGRFGQAIEIRPPATAVGLAGILRFHLGNDLPGADLVGIAQFGVGASAAQAMEWVRAGRRVARAAKRAVTVDDLRAQILPPDRRGEGELTRSAHHEAGHAVVAIVLGLGEVQHVSLISDGSTGGRMRLAAMGRYAFTDRESIERFAVMHLGGRAAEIVFFGSGSAGAGGTVDSDLGKATKLVVAIHTSFGLGTRLAFRAEVDDQVDIMRFDPELRDAVEQDLQTLLGVAQTIVERHRYAVQRIAEELLRRRFLSGSEVKALLDRATAECVGKILIEGTEGDRNGGGA